MKSLFGEEPDGDDFDEDRNPFKIILISLALIAVIVPLVDTYSTSLSNSIAERELKKFLGACRKFWNAGDPSKRCGDEIMDHPQYGFAPSQKVDIHGTGSANNFSAMATHETGDTIYLIDAKGRIFEKPKK